MIAFDRVSKSFGRFVALDGVSLRIERGERVALVGPNGSGKTTLLRALLGLVRVRGRVTVAAVDVGERPDVALAHVAYVPQVPPPIDAPVVELVRAHAALRRIPEYETTEMAARLGLELDVLAPMRFRDLPSTTKSRLLAAMALASGADVLACDEPCAGLDEPARAALFEVLEERSGEEIVVLCSQRRQDVLKLVDRVVEMRDGRVARDEHVVRRSGPRKTILAQVMT